jgi:Protein of unknown function (DUF3108)
MRTPTILILALALALPARAEEAILLPFPGIKRPKTDELEPAGKLVKSSTCRKQTAALDIERMPFGPGEELAYDIAYFGIRTGRAHLRVGDRTTLDGVSTYPLQAQVKTDGFLEILGNLDVRMTSFLDPRFMTPTRMVNQTIAKGGAFGGGTVVSREDGAFAPQRIGPQGPIGGEVNARLERSGEGAFNRRARLETDADVVDALSVVYYLRSRKLVQGQAFCFELYHRRRLWRVEGKAGALETARAPFGARQSRRLDATIVRVGGKNPPPPRAITAYISNDAERLPLLVQTPERVGTIEVRLVTHKAGRQLVPR